MLSCQLTVPVLLFLTLVEHTLAAVHSLYTLDIKPNSSNIQTCKSAVFIYTVSPCLSINHPVDLLVSVETVDRITFKVLDDNAKLGEGTWTWNAVDVQAGRHIISMVSRGTEKHDIRGKSDPFTVRLANTDCFDPVYSGVSAHPWDTRNSHLLTTFTKILSSSTLSDSSASASASTPSPPPPTTSSSLSIANCPDPAYAGGLPQSSVTAPCPSLTLTRSPSSPVPPSTSISSSPPNVPSLSKNISVGVKVGISVAAVVVVLASVGAFFWLFTIRRRLSRQQPGNFGNYGQSESFLDTS